MRNWRLIHMVKTSTAMAKMDGIIAMGKWLHCLIMVMVKGKVGMPLIRRAIVGFSEVIVFIPAQQAETSLTITCRHIPRFTSGSAPLDR